MSMDAMLNAAYPVATAGVLWLLAHIAFFMKLPERKKKWKQCASCKKRQEAK